VTARNVAGLVDTLERDGLAEPLPHPTDRRAILVRLTPAGDRLAGELLTEQRAALAELLASFPRPTSATSYRP
jgi:DNA-binding MarR family transcriptional regulator